MLSRNNNNDNRVIQSVKLILMSSGVVFIGVLFYLSFPGAHDLGVPSLWHSLVSSTVTWLRPPYLYIIINAIILTIARLHHHADSAPHHQQDLISVRSDHHQLLSAYDSVFVREIVDDSVNNVSVKDFVADGEVERIDNHEKIVVDDDDQKEEERSVFTNKVCRLDQKPLERQKALDSSPEFFRPPASTRFANHRRPLKPTPAEGGKALRVAKPKKHDTFESTWKTITEGRHVPLTRHLKKFDMWQNQSRQIDLLNDPAPLGMRKKSETFKDRTNNTSPCVVPSRLKKEPSLGQEELNRRVEAFINKFNEDMRLQRQQSMQQFLEKINRAAY